MSDADKTKQEEVESDAEGPPVKTSPEEKPPGTRRLDPKPGKPPGGKTRRSR